MIPDDVHQLFQATYDFIYSQVLLNADWLDAVAVVESRQASFNDSYGIYSDILPILTGAAAGGDAQRAIPLAAAWVLYDLASEIFDDLQDRDGKDRIWNQWPPARAMSVGLGMVANGDFCLTRLQVAEDVLRQLLELWSRTMVQAARDQWHGIETPSYEQYFQRTVTKSGLIYAMVSLAGAKLEASERAIQEAMYQYGLSLGMITQIWDDCLDLLPGKAKSDLIVGDYTLPVLYALSLNDHPLYPELKVFISRSRTLTAADVADVCRVLEQMGAISYCAALIKAYEQKALSALAGIQDSQYKAHLEDYVSAFLLSSPDAQ